MPFLYIVGLPSDKEKNGLAVSYDKSWSLELFIFGNHIFTSSHQPLHCQFSNYITQIVSQTLLVSQISQQY